MHCYGFLTLLVHVPLVFAASVGCSQTGELRTGAAALADWKATPPAFGALLVSDDANGTIFRVTRK